MNQLTIGSLFSGYGGLDLAVTELFDAKVIWHIEYDKAPSQILKHQWQVKLWAADKVKP
jgi:DNA (cytosine-5)-methyltransferase 1